MSCQSRLWVHPEAFLCFISFLIACDLMAKLFHFSSSSNGLFSPSHLSVRSVVGSCSCSVRGCRSAGENADGGCRLSWSRASLLCAAPLRPEEWGLCGRPSGCVSSCLSVSRRPGCPPLSPQVGFPVRAAAVVSAETAAGHFYTLTEPPKSILKDFKCCGTGKLLSSAVVGACQFNKIHIWTLSNYCAVCGEFPFFYLNLKASELEKCEIFPEFLSCAILFLWSCTGSSCFHELLMEFLLLLQQKQHTVCSTAADTAPAVCFQDRKDSWCQPRKDSVCFFLLFPSSLASFSVQLTFA